MGSHKKTEHVWLAEEYHLNSSIQENAALQLLKKIGLKGNEQVLDIGCGDGKISASIAKQLPRGSVLAIDASSEMVNFAQKKYPKDHFYNLSFLQQDARHINYPNRFDILISSFALQWIPDLCPFFEGARTSLKKNGYLLITVPLDISKALEESVRSVIAESTWSSYFKEFSTGWHFKDEPYYSELLKYYHFLPSKLEVVTEVVHFAIREALENYIFPWFSYLQPLPESSKSVFFKQVIDKYLELQPRSKDGIPFIFSRLDLIATQSVP